MKLLILLKKILALMLITFILFTYYPVNAERTDLITTYYVTITLDSVQIIDGTELGREDIYFLINIDYEEDKDDRNSRLPHEGSFLIEEEDEPYILDIDIFKENVTDYIQVTITVMESDEGEFYGDDDHMGDIKRTWEFQNNTNENFPLTGDSGSVLLLISTTAFIFQEIKIIPNNPAGWVMLGIFVVLVVGGIIAISRRT